MPVVDRRWPRPRRQHRLENVQQGLASGSAVAVCMVIEPLTLSLTSVVDAQDIAEHRACAASAMLAPARLRVTPSLPSAG